MKVLIIQNYRNSNEKYGQTPSGSRKELEADIRRQLMENGFLILGPKYSYSIVELDEIQAKSEKKDIPESPYNLNFLYDQVITICDFDRLVYKDNITKLIGFVGYNLLLEAGMLEEVASGNGYTKYKLIGKEEVDG